MELPYTYKLETPVTHGETTISELVFNRRPMGKDVKGIRLSQIDLGDHVILLTARLTNNPPSVIEKLDFADIASLGEVLSSFLQRGQKTGRESAES